MDTLVSPPPHTIVVVDDDAALLNALDFALVAEGFHVEAFRTARSMFEASGLDQAACLVIDQVLPDEPGLDLIARLRARGNRTPAVLITTRLPRSLHSLAAGLGVPIIEKPLLDDQLFACIRGLIAAREPRRPAARDSSDS